MNNRRRSALLVFWGRRGSGENTLHSMAVAVDEGGGVRVSVSTSSEGFASWPRGELERVAGPSHSWRPASASWWRSIASALRRLVGAARRSDVTVFIARHPLHVLAIPVARLAGARVITCVHEPGGKRGETVPFRSGFTDWEAIWSHELIVFSESVASELAVRWVGRKRPIHRAQLGSLRLFAKDPPPDVAWDGSRPLEVQMVGRLAPYKGVDTFVRVAQLVESTAPGRCRFVLAGSGDLDACLRTAEGSRLATDGVVVINKWLEDHEVEELLAAAHVLLLPYRDATQSGILPTAQGRGVVPVVTAVGGLGEQVVDDVSGVTVEGGEESAAAMARVLVQLFEDPDRLERLRQGALEAARSDWDPFVHTIQELAERPCRTVDGLSSRAETRRRRALAR